MSQEPSESARKPHRFEIKVFISHRDSTCAECESELGRGAWIHLVEGKGALCLACADLDHLVFLPSGDAALTRRSQKYSTLAAVVLKWSRARNRYERQGLLVEEPAVDRAHSECLEDADSRAALAERRAERAAEIDTGYVARFAAAVRERYPRCPEGRERVIAEHACRKYSGRVGRSSAAKSFTPESIDLAVRAHVRHAETHYDRLMAKGVDRLEARRLMSPIVDRVLERWKPADADG
jgi:hypothetical protein